MSSSRSIAAARQKRANEGNNNMNTSRPVTSISSQAVFSQQQQPRNPNQINVAPSRQQRNGQRQNVNKPTQQDQNYASASGHQNQLTKISIPNAIGLITLRLGKLEKVIQESLEEGGLSLNNGGNNINDNNLKLVSDEVFENIIERLDGLESQNNNNLNENLTRINKEIKDIKDSINNLSMKMSTFINETNEKFLDFESVIVDIEKKMDFEPLTDENREYVNEELTGDDGLIDINLQSVNETHFVVEDGEQEDN
jgi:hypothetical protein